MTKGQCWNMAQKGVCRFGERCRFSHDVATQRLTPKPKPRGQGCLECGESGHGFTDCPVRKKRAADYEIKDAAIAANVASMEVMKKDMEELRALLPSITGKFAAVQDPYYTGGELSSLFRAPGGPADAGD